MKLKALLTLFILVFISGCKGDSDKCDDHVWGDEAFATAQNSMVYISPLDRIIFVTEETPDACYSYAINYIENSYIKYDEDEIDQCYPSYGYRVHNRTKINETSSKLIEEKELLTIEEATSYIKEYCNLNLNSDYRPKIDTVDSIELKNDELHFTYSVDDQAYGGKLSTSEMGLACPLYSIYCNTYTVLAEED